MNSKLEQIEYRRGMLSRGMKTKDLPAKVWRGTGIPVEVRETIDAENLLNLGGVYGDKTIGYPVQYDHLKLVFTDTTVEITVFNRAITLFIENNDRVRRIHRAVCKLDK
ncbi:MAG TPA: hypothetical protein PLX02_12585 [Syntrophorhabdaceae bacterium]|nr:hypothetical protein [Syntrophorhabdaceae bacterium]HQM81165.1 hypothetical protein [Syntrophorhabdaceae bacterium]HQM82449.1 hypothetical protein [Syntrophorhabdaceae bacterium]